MKRFIDLSLLLAAVLCLAACGKSDDNTGMARDIVYMVDADQHRASTRTEAEWQAMLDDFCNYAQQGSTVTFWNGAQAKSLPTKEVTTYSTTNREEMKAWMARMEDNGKTVTVSYDPATGTYNGMAYAGAPQPQPPAGDAFDGRGATRSLFSVSEEGRRIRFSRGNLLSLSARDIWQMEPEQYVFHGNKADTTSVFVWNVGDSQPWMTGRDTVFAGLVGQWRIMTSEEWLWLMELRSASTVGTTANARWTPITVDGVRGLLLFPDDYSHPASVVPLADINQVRSSSWDDNDYSLDDWSLMEDAGAVFLFMTGYLNEGTVSYTNARGCYWVAADYWGELNVLTITTNLVPGLSGPNVCVDGWWGDMGASVRLVCNE